MDEAQSNQGPGRTTEISVEDLRAAPRFTLLIRSAKLICDHGEYLCIIRDVSASGVRLRTFHPLPQIPAFTLELSSGERFELERVWEGGDHAGFRFADWIDVQDFIAEASPYPKRALRLRIEFPATLEVDGKSAEARIRDLSREGARIETDLPLAIRQKLRISAKGFPSLTGSVTWRSATAYGLVFQQVFTFDELAKLAAQLQPVNRPLEAPQASVVTRRIA
ncbi:PilZ domain-containing protein [Novosphingobium sp. JCM 18896]|uniref:PilZ domain-containing protein n=1 Tax=Novosphingobium sp. JCM 18896 TaxID=2989731 RepID=UPI0022234DD5|nr:PilZ domain-containing protein [Novosphingobium sp. JCM 18896]MCW1429438.1 PilZ domain-containing protein [Novosphingobium sp. JCM 18896]